MLTVYFATNRNPNHAMTPTGFGDLRFGKATVTKGKLDSKSVQILADNPKQGSEAFFDELRQTMKTDSVDSLIFIHGFNVTFKEALESAAKMGERYVKVSCDNYKPDIFVFSWPSDGMSTNYFNDRHDAEASGYAFARGLMKLASFLPGSPKKKVCRQKLNLMRTAWATTA